MTSAASGPEAILTIHRSMDPSEFNSKPRRGRLHYFGVFAQTVSLSPLASSATVPAKFAVALTALALSAVSAKRASQLLNAIDTCTSTLDGRASQLEALKEEGVVNATSKEELAAYRNWLYSLDPKLCRK